MADHALVREIAAMELVAAGLRAVLEATGEAARELENVPTR